MSEQGKSMRSSPPAEEGVAEIMCELTKILILCASGGEEVEKTAVKLSLEQREG